MNTKIKTALLLVFSIIAFYFVRLYIVPEWIWNHFYTDLISDYESFFALPFATLCIFLILPIFNAVIANAMPYLFIKFFKKHKGNKDRNKVIHIVICLTPMRKLINVT